MSRDPPRFLCRLLLLPVTAEEFKTKLFRSRDSMQEHSASLDLVLAKAVHLWKPAKN